MDVSIIKSVSIISFLAIIGFLAIISLLAIYVFIRYGRTRSFTVVVSLVYAGVFILAALAAFVTLMTIF